MSIGLTTPLGSLVLRAAAGASVFQLEAPLALAETPASRFRVFSPGFDAELFSAEVDPGLLPEQHVERCLGLIWRVRAEEGMAAGQELQFTLTWSDETSWTDVGWHTGQTVVSRSWRAGLTEVNVGTPDPEGALPFYGEHDNFSLPSRWFYQHAEVALWVSEGQPRVNANLAGLSVHYPALRRGETCHAQFVVAWKERRDLLDDDTDFAVDLAPQQILNPASGRNNGF